MNWKRDCSEHCKSAWKMVSSSAQLNAVTHVIHAGSPTELKSLCWNSLLNWGPGGLTLILALQPQFYAHWSISVVFIEINLRSPDCEVWWCKLRMCAHANNVWYLLKKKKKGKLKLQFWTFLYYFSEDTELDFVFQPSCIEIMWPFDIF